MIRRRGHYRPEDFERLHLNTKIDLRILKQKWLEALSSAEVFINLANPETLGALFYSTHEKCFVSPDFKDKKKKILLHFCKKGGILPVVSETL